MKPILLSLIVGAAIASGAAADEIYLSADFESHEADSAIGTGGAAVGEPIQVTSFVTAIVRAIPMASQSLEIQDIDDYTAGYAWFEFLDSVEVTGGQLTIAADLWFQELEDYTISIREQGSLGVNFTDISFNSGGGFIANDGDGYAPNLGTYEIGRLYPIVLCFDMDAGTYDLWFDRQLVFSDRTHGGPGEGIGSVLFKMTGDPDLDGLFNVDNILVSDSFTPVDASTWGEIKAHFAY
jgi:hypothetical protein